MKSKAGEREKLPPKSLPRGYLVNMSPHVVLPISAAKCPPEKQQKKEYEKESGKGGVKVGLTRNIGLHLQRKHKIPSTPNGECA